VPEAATAVFARQLINFFPLHRFNLLNEQLRNTISS
jgi:hypothetical protein